jgi:arylsulfatase A-like enzyme
MALGAADGDSAGNSRATGNADAATTSHGRGIAPTWQAAALAWVAPAAANAVALGATSRVPSDWLGLQAFNLLEHGALAFLCYLSIKLWNRGSMTGRASALIALFVLGNLFGWLVLPDDVRNFSERHSDLAPPWFTQAILVTLIASSIALTWIVSRTLGARRLWRLCLTGAALSTVVVNHLVLPGDYRGIHLYLCLVAVTALATVLVHPPGARLLEIVSTWLTRHAAQLTALRLLGSVAVGVFLVVGPTGSVRTALLRSESAPLHRLLGRLRGETTRAPAGANLDLGEWLRPRPEGYLESEATGPAFFARPIVLLVTVDALRADLVDGKHDRQLPSFARLRKESVWFDHARAPGTLTKVSVASVFTGKYFSQQYWSKDERGRTGIMGDPTLRFPEYIRAAAIPTVNFNAISWLRNGRGCVKGFAEEYRIKDSRQKYTPAQPVMNAIVKRLKGVKAGPFFLHTHLSDPHAPYNLATGQGTQFERYLGEVALVDQQLGRLLDALERYGIADRVILIVQADHGEAFGEHGSQTHGTTLYDEVLRVPLMFKIPGVTPRRVTTPVSTMDLGPTILESFGLPVPASFMGQSLVATLKGASIELTRPILAENRLQQTLILPSGLKVIYDTRTHSAELYDLSKDPGELEDLSGNSDLIAEPLATLQAFFEAHRYKLPGYQPPYIR